MTRRYWTMTLTALLALTSGAQTTMRDTTITAVRIGYSEDNLNMVAGAIDKVTEEHMNKGLITSSLDAFSGRAAGVQVSTGNNQEAMVSAVRVRGNTSLTGGNDPLVIIDGVAADVVILSTIYPADIESFTILKDASETAQYGSRGAAGVIAVTTKKGRSQAFHISYDGTIGFESIYKRIDMLNASQFKKAANDMDMPVIDKGYDTDFTRSIGRTGFVQNHHVAFGGGSESANYRASVGMMDHRTVLRNNNYKNYIAKLDISQKAFDNHLTVDLGMVGSLQMNDVIPFKQKLLFSAEVFNPTYPDGANADGSYEQVTEAIWCNNPNSLLTMENDESNGHFNVHVSTIITLARNLELKGFGSYAYASMGDAHYYPTTVWSHGEAYRGDSKREEMLGNISLDYSLNIRQHAISLLALSESSHQREKGFHTTTTGFSTDAFGYDKLSAGAIRPWDGTDSYFMESHMESFLFRAQYSFAERYTLTANARGDASSKFGKNHRWGFFPSISGAWVISKEKWMEPLTLVNNAKLRIGYGLSGNQGGIDSYNSMQLMQPVGIVPFNGSTATVLDAARNANPDLKWEVKKTFNAGLDLSLWNNRLALTVDYYQSKTTDMLYVYTVPVPPFIFNQLLANLGSMENSGLEIGFGITPLHTKDMQLSINMNWSFERNKLLALDGDYNGQHLTASQRKPIATLWGPGINGPSHVTWQAVGEPLGVFILPHCKGLIEYPDGSKEYDITDESYVCGQATPKARMGSNIAFRYRQWDVTMQVNGAFGHKIYNGSALTYMNMLSLPNYNVMQGAPEMNIQDQTISDYWLERGDYVNIDYVTVGWNVPLHSRFIQSLRVSASVNNLATFTGYSGLTPMVNSSVIDGTLGIDDKNIMPVYRSYTCSLSIKF